MKQGGTLGAKACPSNLSSNTAVIHALHYLVFKGVELIGKETEGVIGAGHPSWLVVRMKNGSLDLSLTFPNISL